jgi:hypothetical protein
MNSQDYAMVFSKHLCPDVDLLSGSQLRRPERRDRFRIAWQLLLIIMHCDPGQAQVNSFSVSNIPPAFQLGFCNREKSLFEIGHQHAFTS